MRRAIALGLAVAIESGAVDVGDLVRAYKKGEYKRVCLDGYRIFDTLRKKEELLSMYAFACLKSDYINRLAVPILILGKSPEARKNRSYLSLILTQKNILISSLSDGLKFKGLSVPTSDHIISKVFNAYFQKNYETIDNVYVSKLDGNVTAKFYVVRDKSGYPRLVIEEHRNGKVKKHTYR